MASNVLDEITLPFPNINVEVWEWISISIALLIMNAITYPCCD